MSNGAHLLLRVARYYDLNKLNRWHMNNNMYSLDHMYLDFQVSFYTFVTYLTTSLGTLALAAHQVYLSMLLIGRIRRVIIYVFQNEIGYFCVLIQVMVGLYSAVSVPAESLSQTAQSFMPALIQKPNPKSKKVGSLAFILYCSVNLLARKNILCQCN